MSESKGARRPLDSRGSTWARSMAAWLARTAITPNQISFASIIAALVASVFFAVSANTDGAIRSSYLMLAAVACQLRLLCNLMDGMLAIEAGRQTADGAFWNEVPDRIADTLILVGAGFAAGWPALGWAAATLAVFTAYVRELGKGIDGVVDFTGPMAKPHRMALVTFAAVLAAVFNTAGWILLAALWLLVFGCIITLYRRCQALLLRLERTT